MALSKGVLYYCLDSKCFAESSDLTEYVFGTVRGLVDHVFHRHFGASYVCPECLTFWCRFEKLATHYRRHHPQLIIPNPEFCYPILAPEKQEEFKRFTDGDTSKLGYTVGNINVTPGVPVQIPRFVYSQVAPRQASSAIAIARAPQMYPTTPSYAWPIFNQSLVSTPPLYNNGQLFNVSNPQRGFVTPLNQITRLASKVPQKRPLSSVATQVSQIEVAGSGENGTVDGNRKSSRIEENDQAANDSKKGKSRSKKKDESKETGKRDGGSEEKDKDGECIVNVSK